MALLLGLIVLNATNNITAANANIKNLNLIIAFIFISILVIIYVSFDVAKIIHFFDMAKYFNDYFLSFLFIYDI